jgi:hypothetical protein
LGIGVERRERGSNKETDEVEHDLAKQHILESLERSRVVRRRVALEGLEEVRVPRNPKG